MESRRKKKQKKPRNLQDLNPQPRDHETSTLPLDYHRGPRTYQQIRWAGFCDVNDVHRREGQDNEDHCELHFDVSGSKSRSDLRNETKFSFFVKKFNREKNVSRNAGTDVSRKMDGLRSATKMPLMAPATKSCFSRLWSATDQDPILLRKFQRRFTLRLNLSILIGL